MGIAAPLNGPGVPALVARVSSRSAADPAQSRPTCGEAARRRSRRPNYPMVRVWPPAGRGVV